MLQSYQKLQQQRKTVPEFKVAIQLTRFALAEKAIDSVVKDYRKRLQACVQRWTF